MEKPVISVREKWDSGFYYARNRSLTEEAFAWKSLKLFVEINVLMSIGKEREVEYL